MPVTRRQFIQSSAAAASVSVMLPKLLMAQAPSNRRILVVIQQGGGNDGLNTVIPYSNSRYLSLRPNLKFTDADLGPSMILDNQFGLHPSLSELKGLYDQGKVVPIVGVGYPNPNLSHFTSTDIWMTANSGGSGLGWLGKYADQKLVGQSGLAAVSIGGSLPKAFFASDFIVPNISSFANFTYLTDARYTGDRNNQINTFRANSNRDYNPNSFVAAVAEAGGEAEGGAVALNNAVNTYTSTVMYPMGNPLAAALRMVAQIVTTIPQAQIFHVNYGGFDTHATQITGGATPNKRTGAHATLLQYLSQGIDAFYRDMVEHGLGDQLKIMTYSEFGRRPNENASFGTDHSTSSVMFVVGNKVNGGQVIGTQPSLEASALDRGGNPVFTTDFRSVYATILDDWLKADSRSILGATYPNLGFVKS